MGNQETETHKALSIGSETQLLVDDAIVSAKRGVVRTLHPGKKLEQPVLLPDRPWEGKRVYIYGTVHYDADAQQFRMWYLTRVGRGEQHRAPGLRERQGDMILYATSEDGIHWEKPNLGLHEFDGSRENNILLFDKHSPTIIVDETADPSERYKMAAWDWSRGEFYGMSGFVYGRQFLGFLPVFNVVLDVRGQEVGAEQSPWDGPIEAQLTHSRDGRTWERFVDRSPIIPRGAPAAADRPTPASTLSFGHRPTLQLPHQRGRVNNAGQTAPGYRATVTRALADALHSVSRSLRI